jgi:regulation of enolase protein 1 (concanavalin A-like superfamily)
LHESELVRLLVPLLALLALAMSAGARVGAIRVTDGATLNGHVRFTPAGVVLVNADQNLVVVLSPTNVLSITFPPDVPIEIIGEPIFGVLPPGWDEAEVGAVKLAGSTRHQRETFTVRGSGNSFGGDYDSFHYVYRPVQGDYEIIARVSTIQLTHPNARAGLMMRETMSEYSRNVALAATAERGGEFQVRYFEKRAANSFPHPAVRVGHWLRLRRRGDEFTAFRSANGRRWTQIEQTHLPMSDRYYVGLAVASARDGMLNWTTFDGVRTGPRLASASFVPLVELTSGSSFPGRPVEADAGQILFAGGPRVTKIPTSRVARIIYQPLTSELVWKTRASRPGIWIAGGDFIDGEFQSIAGDQVRLSSVLYGPRTFDVTDNVLAVVLAHGVSTGGRVSPRAVELALTDGSVLFGTSSSYGEGEVILSEPALGKVRVPAFMIRDLRVLQPEGRASVPASRIWKSNQ